MARAYVNSAGTKTEGEIGKVKKKREHLPEKPPDISPITVASVDGNHHRIPSRLSVQIRFEIARRLGREGKLTEVADRQQVL